MQSHRIELYGNIIDLPAPRVFANSIYRIFNPIENNWHNRIIDNFYNIFKNLDDVYENSEKIAQEGRSESVSAALGILAENSIYDVDEKNFIECYLNKYDIFLFVPQVRFKKDDFQKLASTVGKKVEVINQMDYGMLKGEKIFDWALTLI